MTEVEKIHRYQEAVARLAKDKSDMYFANGKEHITFTSGPIIQSAKSSIKILINENNCDHLYEEPTLSDLKDAILKGIKVELIFEDTISPLYKSLTYHRYHYKNLKVIVKNTMYRTGLIIIDDTSFYFNGYEGSNICCFNDPDKVKVLHEKFEYMKQDDYTAY